MEYRTLGSSGAAVSTFALGTMTFGAETDEEGAHEQLDRFVEAGGSSSTPRTCTRRASARRSSGGWLGEQSDAVRDRVVLATKGRFPMALSRRPAERRRAVPPAPDPRARRVAAPARRRRRRPLPGARLRPVDAAGGDARAFLDDVVPRREDPLRRAVELHRLAADQGAAGIARALGLAAPVTLQPQYNLLVREIEWEIVPAAQANGMGLLPWSPLGGGWLTGKYRRDERPTGADPARRRPGPRGRGVRPARPRRADLGRRRRRAGRRRRPRGVDGAGRAGLAGRPAGGHVGRSSGARTSAQLDDNLAAAGLHLSAEETARLDAASDPGAADYPYGGPGIEQRSRKLEGGW